VRRFGADPEFDEDRPQHPEALRQQKAIGRDRIGQQLDERSPLGVVNVRGHRFRLRRTTLRPGSG
jgi:hypothetical protein